MKFSSQRRTVWQAFFVQGGVFDHPAFAEALLADFKLGFDEGDQPGSRFGQRQCSRQHEGQADETGIADHQIYRLGNVMRAEGAGIGAFPQDDPRIILQLGDQLVMADIDRIDFGSP
jgi:hypothetical protein